MGSNRPYYNRIYTVSLFYLEAKIVIFYWLLIEKH